MIKLLTDENFDGDVLRGLLRRIPDLDVVRVQDVGLMATPDPVILEWAAGEDRVLLTHDHQTMVPAAYDRVRAGLSMPGVFFVSRKMSLGLAIEQLLLALQCLESSDCRNSVEHFPY